LPVLQDSEGNSQNGTMTYTFVGDDFPTLVLGLLFGSPSLSIDLVAADSSEGSGLKVVGAIQNATDFDRSIVGEPYTFPITANLADNTTIPDGEYRAFLKVFRVFGNPNNSRDVETYLSPVFIKDSANKTATQP